MFVVDTHLSINHFILPILYCFVIKFLYGHYCKCGRGGGELNNLYSFIPFKKIVTCHHWGFNFYMVIFVNAEVRGGVNKLYSFITIKK